MRFVDVLVQTLAVTIYEQNDGRLDNKKRQYQYFLGRASVCPWNRRRRCGKGTDYDKEVRRLQRKLPSSTKHLNIFSSGEALVAFSYN